MVDAVAIAEGRVDALIEELFERHPSGTNDVTGFLLDEVGARLTQSWSARARVLRGAFGVVVDQKKKQYMDSVIDVRNAFIHGDGSLSPLQTQSWESILQFRTTLRRVLDVHVDGTRLEFTARTVNLALGYVEDYLVALDAAVVDVTQSWNADGAAHP